MKYGSADHPFHFAKHFENFLRHNIANLIKFLKIILRMEDAIDWYHKFIVSPQGLCYLIQFCAECI